MMDVFLETPCLTENTVLQSGSNLIKKWFRNADKRKVGEYLLKFVNYNQKYFDFLGVTPKIFGFEVNSSISFRTSNFIGTIPLRAPDTGKQIGDFVVTPKFSGNNRFVEYSRILNILDDQLNIETIDSLPLASKRVFRPPLYLEACKYIDHLICVSKISWNKFSSIKSNADSPIGTVDWNKYICQEYKVENRLVFPINKNTLNERHLEYSYLKFVFILCKAELLSQTTPENIRYPYYKKIQYLDQRLRDIIPEQINQIPNKSSDSQLIRNCKTIANNILNEELISGTAWRVDFSLVFERYIQFLFTKASNEIGGSVYINPKFSGNSSTTFTWSIKYLEPDAFYKKNNLSIIIDAKYKSNLYNKFDQSEILKTDYRNDLHQILSYSSFNTEPIKYSILCYPSSKIEIYKSEYQNNNNQTENTILIFGIPILADKIDSIVSSICSLFSMIESRHKISSEYLSKVDQSSMETKFVD